jgi:hypothetical protein
MKSAKLNALVTAAMVGGLAAAGAVGSVTLLTTFAHAGNGNGNGNGNSENGAQSKGNKGQNDHSGKGSTASALGALNAAHANPNALLHASPNSRVGRIAAYRDEVLATMGLEADLAEARAILDGLAVPARPTAEVEAELALASGDLADAEALLADLLDDDPPDINAIAEAELARDELAGAVAELEDELAGNLAWDAAAAAVDELELLLDGRDEVERAALEAAANKPVTDLVEAEVRALLGLD